MRHPRHLATKRQDGAASLLMILSSRGQGLLLLLEQGHASERTRQAFFALLLRPKKKSSTSLRAESRPSGISSLSSAGRRGRGIGPSVEPWERRKEGAQRTGGTREVRRLGRKRGRGDKKQVCHKHPGGIDYGVDRTWALSALSPDSRPGTRSVPSGSDLSGNFRRERPRPGPGDDRAGAKLDPEAARIQDYIILPGNG